MSSWEEQPRQPHRGGGVGIFRSTPSQACPPQGEGMLLKPAPAPRWLRSQTATLRAP